MYVHAPYVYMYIYLYMYTDCVCSVTSSHFFSLPQLHNFHSFSTHDANKVKGQNFSGTVGV